LVHIVRYSNAIAAVEALSGFLLNTAHIAAAIAIAPSTSASVKTAKAVNV
jgi:hypothetical protein